MKAFLLALQFLTRIPIPIAINPSAQRLGRSVIYYPLIGVVIGVILLAFAYTLGANHSSLAAAIILTVWVGLTGGLHLDGVADCVDGWIGGQGNLDRSLQIMKDPNAGPMAVIAIVLLLLLKFSALSVLIESNSLAILLAAPIIARASIPFLMLSTPYLRINGLAEQMLQQLPRQLAIASIVLSLLLCTLMAGYLFSLGIMLCALALRFIFLRLFSGTTGDMYGASVEAMELSALLLAVWLLP